MSDTKEHWIDGLKGLIGVLCQWTFFCTKHGQSCKHALLISNVIVTSMKLRKLTTISYTIGEIRKFINSNMKNNCLCNFESKKRSFHLFTRTNAIIMFVNTLVFISSSIKVGCQLIINLNKIYAMKIKLKFLKFYFWKIHANLVVYYCRGATW